MLARPFAVLALLVVSCTTAQPGAAPPAQGTPAARAPAAATPPSVTQATSAPVAAFAELARRSRLSSYAVTYRLATSAGEQYTSLEQTWWVKPPRMRIDSSGPTGTASLFFLESGVFICSGSSGYEACIQAAPAQAQAPAASFTNTVGDYPDWFDASTVTGRTIAGQAARCFNLKPKAGQSPGFSEATMCYGDLAQPLLMRFTGTGLDVSVEAVKVETSISDEAFRLPSEPTRP